MGIEIAIGLGTSAIVGVAMYHYGKYQSRREVNKFIKELDKLIRRAGGTHNKEDLARSIVAVRDDFRESLDVLYKALNKEIDALADLVASDSLTPDQEALVRSRLRVLEEAWPAKKKKIKKAIDVLLKKIGG